ncbi:hypothetical protein EON63_12020 [archaeon]|nr:MAG: hypothetical protein EON63_12020 [archaeon]
MGMRMEWYGCSSRVRMNCRDEYVCVCVWWLCIVSSCCNFNFEFMMLYDYGAIRWCMSTMPVYQYKSFFKCPGWPLRRLAIS